MQLRQIFAAFLVGLVFFAGAALGTFAYPLQAQAASLTPEATDYQVDKTKSQIDVNAEGAKEKAKAAGGGFFENIKEKLNLDEPVPESTKDFLKQAKGEDVQVQEPRPSGKGEEPQNQ